VSLLARKRLISSDIAASIWGTIRPYLDGRWFDICSLLVGIGYSGIRYRKANPRRNWLSKDTGVDVANGVGLFPLFVLAIASFSSTALSELVHSNRLVLSVAGLVALFAILEETPGASGSP
jgi:hypothetical protein